MARQTIVRLTDDLDGSEAAQTIQFAWDGGTYEIDLSAANAEAFTQALTPYLSAARRVSPQRRAPRGATLRGSSARRDRSAGDLAAIRDWANRNGYQVAGRGRIPAAVRDAYQAAVRGGTLAIAAPVASASLSAANSAPRARAAKKAASAKNATRKAPAKKASARTAAVKKSAAKTGATPRTGGARKRATRKTASRT